MERTVDKKSYVLIAVFLLCILLPLLFINRSGAGVAENENRFLAGAPELFEEEGKINSDFWKELSAWMQDHIGFRDFAVNTVNKIKIALMHRPTTDIIHIGSEGWVYFDGDGNLQLGENNGAVDKDILIGSVIRLTQIRDKLAAEGIDFAVVLAPSKTTVYPEYLRYGSGKTGRSQCDVLADYILSNSDIYLIPLKERLIEAKDSWQVYFKSDTHWNHRGAYLAYCETMRKLKEFGMCDSEPASVEFQTIDFNGSLYKMIGDSSEEKTEILTITGGEKDSRRVLIVCDSFFSAWMIPELFAESFSASKICMNEEITDELLQEFEPDIVIYEVTERLQGKITYFSDNFVLG